MTGARTSDEHGADVHGADEHGAPPTQTRHRILAVAVELFAVQGFAATSTRDIAAHAGLTKAALYHHFASKEHILEAVVDPLLVEIRALAESVGATPPPSPAELLEGLVDALSRRAALVRIVMSDPSAGHRAVPQRVRGLVGGMLTGLAGDDSAEGRLRARAAIGAAQVATLATASELAGPPPDREHLVELLEHGRHALDAGQRAAIVAAALRALGPGPTPVAG